MNHYARDGMQIAHALFAHKSLGLGCQIEIEVAEGGQGRSITKVRAVPSAVQCVL